MESDLPVRFSWDLPKANAGDRLALVSWVRQTECYSVATKIGLIFPKPFAQNRSNDFSLASAQNSEQSKLIQNTFRRFVDRYLNAGALLSDFFGHFRNCTYKNIKTVLL